MQRHRRTRPARSRLPDPLTGQPFGSKILLHQPAMPGVKDVRLDAQLPVQLSDMIPNLGMGHLPRLVGSSIRIKRCLPDSATPVETWIPCMPARPFVGSAPLPDHDGRSIPPLRQVHANPRRQACIKVELWQLASIHLFRPHPWSLFVFDPLVQVEPPDDRLCLAQLSPEDPVGHRHPERRLALAPNSRVAPVTPIGRFPPAEQEPIILLLPSDDTFPQPVELHAT